MKTIKNYIAINILVFSTQSAFSHQSVPNPIVTPPRPGISTQQVKDIALVIHPAQKPIGKAVDLLRQGI